MGDKQIEDPTDLRGGLVGADQLVGLGFIFSRQGFERGRAKIFQSG